MTLSARVCGGAGNSRAVSLHLRNIAAKERRFDSLPPEWRQTSFVRFSADKEMRPYQRAALESAACALHLYFSGGGDAEECKHKLAEMYRQANCDLSVFEARRWEDPNTQQRENPIFRILSREFPPHEVRHNEVVPFDYLINRMSFWMATGSGKTLVMIKLAEMLQSLMDIGAIPRRNIMVLAPRRDLLAQIEASVDEYNRAGSVFFDWTPLNKYGEESPSFSFGKSSRLYYWRSDNISDEESEARIDYRKYENDGKWYVLLDEAHKGDREGSKRQAYYSLLARDGFLFNFSATFTDECDIATGAYKYNLQDFVGDGYGKHILLSRAGFGSFRRGNYGGEEIDETQRRKILLKSLVTLAFAKRRARAIRKAIKRDDLYHDPLMMTLVNSVNTPQAQNDLWAFFSLLRDIAGGVGDTAALFGEVKKSLAQEWQKPELCFETAKAFTNSGEQSPAGMTMEQLREAVFNSPKPSALHALDPGNGKELAFQLNGADAPFAMLRIGDITKWNASFLEDMEMQKKATTDSSFFETLDRRKNLNILMGSRSFIEGWDSNRPNVINFINIGGREAKKFIAQAIGRGVRIESSPGVRRRCLQSGDNNQKLLAPASELVAPVETVFVYATNRGAVKSVIESLESESIGSGWRPLNVFEESPLLQNKEKMPLLKPEYRMSETLLANKRELPIGEAAADFLRRYMERAGKAQLIVSQRLLPRQVEDLRAAIGRDNRGNNDESARDWLRRYRLHSRRREKVIDALREMSPNDIVHFRHVETDYAGESYKELAKRIRGVAKFGERGELHRRLENKEITIQEYDRLAAEVGDKEEDEYGGYAIRRIVEHYYAPIVSAGEYVGEQHLRHIISTAGEARFIGDLVEWLKKNNNTGWDKWMFSKLDESLDKINIPYYDPQICEYSNFYPDFVFWLQSGNNYRIVFVDPKGTQHAGYFHKIGGYKAFFENEGGLREFSFRQEQGETLRISVKLVLYNKDTATVPDEARRFWHSSPKEIFARD